jgi:hypothetical protein
MISRMIIFIKAIDERQGIYKNVSSNSYTNNSYAFCYNL